MKGTLAFFLAALTASFAVHAQAQSGALVPVTVDNFVRAESDLYMGRMVKDGGVGKFHHRREPARIDDQVVIRLNRDTLYSSGLFDLEAGPVTITLPDAGKRFMSLQLISEDHYTPAVYYGAGSYTIDKNMVGTRYVAAAVRTLVDPSDPKDVQQVHALQDAIKVSQKGKVDPVARLMGAAAGWGGNPDKDATYLNIVPARNDGKTLYKLNVKNVPVQGFWSVSLYNAKGYYEPNPFNAYSINNITANKAADGSVSIHFGGCDGKIPNCLPIMDGWNYTVRLYRPRNEILTGKWKFPEPQAVN